jgi:hypothetical protein
MDHEAGVHVRIVPRFGEFFHIGTPEALAEAEAAMGDIFFRLDSRRAP